MEFIWMLIAYSVGFVFGALTKTTIKIGRLKKPTNPEPRTIRIKYEVDVEDLERAKETFRELRKEQDAVSEKA